jgi:tellurite resistance protein TerC
MEMTWLWLAFGGVVVVLMALDLGVFHRKAHAVGFRESLAWTGVWMALALALAAFVHFERGGEIARAYVACYLTEYALSVDNLFVFVVLFRFFAIEPASQHRVLFWGILGALAMRAVFIFLGVELVERFHWTTYVLGAFLVLTGLKLAFASERQVEPEKNPVMRFSRRFLRVTTGFEGTKFFVRRDGVLFATPLFLCLLVVETTDVLFAVDSVPAGLGIVDTIADLADKRFVLYSSNVMAICGLRSLYFAVAGLMGLFRFLQHGLAVILVFVGVKMLIAQWYKIPVTWALGAVVGILAVSVALSAVFRQREVAGKGE